MIKYETNKRTVSEFPVVFYFDLILKLKNKNI